MGEKERFEVLLEEVHHDVKTIAEGLVMLREEMQRGFQTVAGEFVDVRREVADLRGAFKHYAKLTDQRLIVLETRLK